MSDEPRECCAHLRVAYRPIENSDGSKRERWQCETCGHEFRPVTEPAVIPALCAWPTCKALAKITHVMVRADGIGGVENVPLCDEHSEAVIVKGLVGIPRDPRVGDPGVRDPDAPCEHYEPGSPKGTPHDCDGDGHYLCERCVAWNGAKR